MSVTEPTTQRFQDITSATLAATLGITSIESISYSKKVKKIKGSGDADTGLTYLAKGMAEITGTIKMTDPVQADALTSEAAGDFVFTGTNAMTGYVLTVTVGSCLFFDEDGTEKHDDLGSINVTFQGLTLTVADASGS